MKIKTQFLLSAALALLVALGAITLVTQAVRQVDRADAEQAHAEATAREAAGLLALAQEFARDPEPHAAQQWRQRQAAIQRELADSRDGPALDSLRNAMRALPPLFQRLTEVSEPPSTVFMVRRRDMLVGQLLTDTQALADAAYRWSREAAAEQRATQRRLQRLGFTTLALLLLVIGGQTLLVWRRVLRPLRGLVGATDAVERGDLSVRMGSHARDEFGHLARRFDAMAASQQQRKLELHHEAELRRASEERIRAITDNAPAVIAQFDVDGRCVFANPYCGAVLGMDHAALIGRSVHEVSGPSAGAQLQANIPRVLAGERVSFEAARRVDGTQRWFETHCVPDRASDGTVHGFYLIAFDITERKAAEAAIAASEQRLQTITDNLPVLISYIDPQHVLRFINATSRAWLGAPPHGLVGRPLLEIAGPALYAQRLPYLQRALAGERQTFELESEAQGVSRCLQNTYVPDLRPDGTVAGVYTLSTDVTAMKLVERHLDQLTRVDVLTGLANRREFEQRLPEAMARSRRSRRPLALMFMDVDHFKHINDSLGHAAGDEVLRAFAQRLQRALRETDTVARLAGDEFVVILEGLNTVEEPQFVARKLLATIDAPFEVDGHTLAVSTSIGVALYEGGDISAPGLVARADKALYAAKAAGRATFRVAPRVSSAP